MRVREATTFWLIFCPSGELELVDVDVSGMTNVTTCNIEWRRNTCVTIGIVLLLRCIPAFEIIFGQYFNAADIEVLVRYTCCVWVARKLQLLRRVADDCLDMDG